MATIREHVVPLYSFAQPVRLHRAAKIYSAMLL